MQKAAFLTTRLIYRCPIQDRALTRHCPYCHYAKGSLYLLSNLYLTNMILQDQGFHFEFCFANIRRFRAYEWVFLVSLFSIILWIMISKNLSNVLFRIVQTICIVSDTVKMTHSVSANFYSGTDNRLVMIKRSKSNRKAMNRNWSKQKANPALKTKTGNK